MKSHRIEFIKHVGNSYKENLNRRYKQRQRNQLKFFKKMYFFQVSVFVCYRRVFTPISTKDVGHVFHNLAHKIRVDPVTFTLGSQNTIWLEDSTGIFVKILRKQLLLRTHWV